MIVIPIVKTAGLRAQTMKNSIWMIALTVISASAGFTAVEDQTGYADQERRVYLQFPAAHAFDGSPISGEELTKIELKEFAVRLNDLRNWELDLDELLIELRQENSDLQLQLEQNCIDQEQVGVDRRSIQQFIYELKHDRDLFERETKLQRARDKLHSND